MKLSFVKGLSYGLTSAAITTMGLIVGLDSSTHAKMVVLGGIIVIALADAFSDSLGIHISEESESVHSTKEIWESTLATFFSKFFFALTFAIPILLLPLEKAVMVSVAWGLSLIVFLSYAVARKDGVKPYRVVFEHLTIAVVVVIVTYCVGGWVATFS